MGVQRPRSFWLLPAFLLLVPFLVPDRAAAQCGNCQGATLPVKVCGLAAPAPSGNGCGGQLKVCMAPIDEGNRIDVVETAPGVFEARLVVRVRVPWNSDSGTLGAAKLNLWWQTGSTATHPTTSLCQNHAADRLETYLFSSGLTCAGAPYSLGTYSLRAIVCSGAGSCQKITDFSGLEFNVTKQTLGCPIPRKDECKKCEASILTAGCSMCVGGQGPVCKVPASGAHLYYAAGGAGSNAAFPGTASWTPVLGRNWSHDYAQRIFLDPDDSHVWLITPKATFREWSGLSGGIYGTASPSDEKRTLRRTAGGWELVELDGTVHFFNGAGLWSRTADRNGNEKTAQYNVSNQLVEVHFPDQRKETFAYHASGKLASITEVGVGGSPTRTWSYTWSGDDLFRVDRPDGTAWELFYHATLPGALVRWDLIGTDLVRRIEGAWEYDSRGNVSKAWRGDPSSTGPNAVDLYTFSYDNPALPAQTQVTDPLGKVTTYLIDRVTDVARVTQVNGDCPACAAGPNAQYTYADPVNPLLPTQVIDGRLLTTQYAYNAKGQMISKTEAVGTPLARTTLWQYGEAGYPAFPTRIEVPSTSGGAAQRVTVLSYNASGDLVTRTVQGAEAGSSFSYATAATFNAAGKPLTIDPPGYGTADQTAFTYDPARGNLLPLTRTDPLTGTTSLAYDGLNRRTSVTDPNGLETVTTYDNLHRVTSVTRKGATAGDDLVTTHGYNAFGDLFRTTLPRGNVVEYGYDAAGRLLSIERKPDATTHGERTFYTLDTLGHRTKEALQRWNGTSWVTESFRDFVYSSRCHLDKVVNADGTATEYGYDCDGNLEKIWAANHPRASNPNPTLLYVYDSLNRMTSVTAGPGTANAAASSYTYDVQDHIGSMSDAEGNLTTYTTSDRDLMTQQVSPVSGTTGYTYNEHGELLTATDARAMVATRTVDAADRVTQETFGPSGAPDPSLTTTYAHGSTPAQFDAGRLTGITRDGQTITYTYDRFGRLLQDGALIYGYDKNGNRTTIVYPSGVSADYTHDFADREATLSYDTGGGPQLLVTSASYKALGPLSSLSFGNGLSETRLFDQRYLPDRIQAGTLLDWDYTVDAVGNPTAITGSIAGTPYSTSFAYQDHLYFLTQGNGPWGNRAWTYDKVGNRLTSTRTSEPTQTYTYSGAGHNPRLAAITPAPGWGTGSWTYAYDPAGNPTSVAESNDEGAVQTTFYDMAADSRLSALRTNLGPSRTDFLYDGRGFLRQALLTVAGSTDTLRVNPVYSSRGVLMARTEVRQWTGGTIGPDGEDLTTSQMSTESTRVFYFAGRPVAQLTTGPELLYLTTDHLGTPILAADASAAAVWAGGVEPFGAAWTAGPDNPDTESSTTGGLRLASAPALSRLSSDKVFLRYPGQWSSDAFRAAGTQGELYYNVARWHSPLTGSYTTPDPIGLQGGPNPYQYVLGRPTALIDPLGLRVQVCCRPLISPFDSFRHCFIRIVNDRTGAVRTEALHTTQTTGNFARAATFGSRGRQETNANFDTAPLTQDDDCGAWAQDPCGAVDACAIAAAAQYPRETYYHVLGPNSNTFASYVATRCTLPIPLTANGWNSPGWWTRDDWGLD